MSAHGPFQTERQAHEAALRLGTSSGGVLLSPTENCAMLAAACRAAGVELGEYDERIVRWLADWPDAYAAVVAGLIERAFQAGRVAS